MFEHEIIILKNNASKYTLSLQGGFYATGGKLVYKISRAYFMSLKQAESLKASLESKGAGNIEIIPVSMYLDAVA